MVRTRYLYLTWAWFGTGTNGQTDGRTELRLLIRAKHCVLSRVKTYIWETGLWFKMILNLRSANRHRLIVPHCRLNTYGRRAFPVAGSTVWNTLPDELRERVSTASNSSLKQSCSAFASATSALISNVMRSINLHFTYLFFTQPDVQDSSAELDEKCRATLMLCYGYITLYAPPELAVSRLEANILNVVVPQLASVKVCHRASVLFSSLSSSSSYSFI